MRPGFLLMASATFLFVMPAHSHHSASMFDATKEILLDGTVKEVQWTNPHVWVQLQVPDKQGKLVVWSIEGASPNGLKRQGWSSRTLKAGDKVSITIQPLRDGRPGGNLVRVKLPDGSVLGRPEGARPARPAS